MPIWKHYYLAQDIQDALQALVNAAGSARLVAGGTDLLLDLQQGRHPPVETLVDVTRIPKMTRLEVGTERLFIGAALPLNRILASSAVIDHAQALHEAAGLIGGPQVRNTATLGGNVAHSLPAADGAIALLALDAQAEVADLHGSRLVPLEELFLGPGRSALDARQEILLGFHLSLRQPGQGSTHRRVMRPQGVAIAILNMAVWIATDGEVITSIRIAVGPAAPKPFRACRTEETLRGRPPDHSALKDALHALLDEAHFRTSPHRATASYRRHLAGVLLTEAVQAAWQRAGQSFSEYMHS